MVYVRAERILLRGHPEFSERWLQDRISEDPKIIGLGDLVLRDKERSQPRAGRLDLLLQDVEAERRYEVELQLGATDEAHIIRTIEYWDIERKRYPQYDHCAVLIAEDVTSRFLNVVSLFNGSVPLIAIQLSALRVGENITLAFTTVLNELSRGPIGEDEEEAAAPTDRAYWERRSSPQILALADQLVAMVHAFAPGYQLRYNKYYVGLSLNGTSDNFVIFRPQRNRIRVEPQLPRTEEITVLIENSGLDTNYDVRWSRYRIPINVQNLHEQKVVLADLLKRAYQNRHP